MEEVLSIALPSGCRMQISYGAMKKIVSEPTTPQGLSNGVDIEGWHGEFMIDTGATLSLVSCEFYEGISQQPDLYTSTVGLWTAAGSLIAM